MASQPPPLGLPHPNDDAIGCDAGYHSTGTLVPSASSDDDDDDEDDDGMDTTSPELTASTPPETRGGPQDGEEPVAWFAHLFSEAHDVDALAQELRGIFAAHLFLAPVARCVPRLLASLKRRLMREVRPGAPPQQGREQGQELAEGETQAAVAPAPAPAPAVAGAGAGAGAAAALHVGQHVEVAGRHWAGINKPGGAAEITRVSYDDEESSHVYSVKYFMGGRENDVLEKYIRATNLLQEGRGGGRRGRGTMGRCPVCPCFIKDCLHYWALELSAEEIAEYKQALGSDGAVAGNAAHVTRMSAAEREAAMELVPVKAGTWQLTDDAAAEHRMRMEKNRHLAEVGKENLAKRLELIRAKKGEIEAQKAKTAQARAAAAAARAQAGASATTPRDRERGKENTTPFVVIAGDDSDEVRGQGACSLQHLPRSRAGHNNHNRTRKSLLPPQRNRSEENFVANRIFSVITSEASAYARGIVDNTIDADGNFLQPEGSLSSAHAAAGDQHRALGEIASCSTLVCSKIVGLINSALEQSIASASTLRPLIAAALQEVQSSGQGGLLAAQASDEEALACRLTDLDDRLKLLTTLTARGCIDAYKLCKRRLKALLGADASLARLPHVLDYRDRLRRAFKTLSQQWYDAEGALKGMVRRFNREFEGLHGVFPAELLDDLRLREAEARGEGEGEDRRANKTGHKRPREESRGDLRERREGRASAETSATSGRADRPAPNPDAVGSRAHYRHHNPQRRQAESASASDSADDDFERPKTARKRTEKDGSSSSTSAEADVTIPEHFSRVHTTTRGRGGDNDQSSAARPEGEEQPAQRRKLIKGGGAVSGKSGGAGARVGGKSRSHEDQDAVGDVFGSICALCEEGYASSLQPAAAAAPAPTGITAPRHAVARAASDLSYVSYSSGAAPKPRPGAIVVLMPSGPARARPDEEVGAIPSAELLAAISARPLQQPSTNLDMDPGAAPQAAMEMAMEVEVDVESSQNEAADLAVAEELLSQAWVDSTGTAESFFSLVADMAAGTFGTPRRGLAKSRARRALLLARVPPLKSAKKCPPATVSLPATSAVLAAIAAELPAARVSRSLLRLRPRALLVAAHALPFFLEALRARSADQSQCAEAVCCFLRHSRVLESHLLAGSLRHALCAAFAASSSHKAISRQGAGRLCLALRYLRDVLEAALPAVESLYPRPTAGAPLNYAGLLSVASVLDGLRYQLTDALLSSSTLLEAALARLNRRLKSLAEGRGWTDGGSDDDTEAFLSLYICALPMTSRLFVPLQAHKATLSASGLAVPAAVVVSRDKPWTYITDLLATRCVFGAADGPEANPPSSRRARHQPTLALSTPLDLAQPAVINSLQHPPHMSDCATGKPTSTRVWRLLLLHTAVMKVVVMDALRTGDRVPNLGERLRKLGDRVSQQSAVALVLLHTAVRGQARHGGSVGLSEALGHFLQLAAHWQAQQTNLSAFLGGLKVAMGDRVPRKKGQRFVAATALRLCWPEQVPTNEGGPGGPLHAAAVSLTKWAGAQFSSAGAPGDRSAFRVHVDALLDAMFVSAGLAPPSVNSNPAAPADIGALQALQGSLPALLAKLGCLSSKNDRSKAGQALSSDLLPSSAFVRALVASPRSSKPGPANAPRVITRAIVTCNLLASLLSTFGGQGLLYFSKEAPTPTDTHARPTDQALPPLPGLLERYLHLREGAPGLDSRKFAALLWLLALRGFAPLAHCSEAASHLGAQAAIDRASLHGVLELARITLESLALTPLGPGAVMDDLVWWSLSACLSAGTAALAVVRQEVLRLVGPGSASTLPAAGSLANMTSLVALLAPLAERALRVGSLASFGGSRGHARMLAARSACLVLRAGATLATLCPKPLPHVSALAAPLLELQVAMLKGSASPEIYTKYRAAHPACDAHPEADPVHAAGYDVAFSLSEWSAACVRSCVSSSPLPAGTILDLHSPFARLHDTCLGYWLRMVYWEGLLSSAHAASAHAAFARVLTAARLEELCVLWVACAGARPAQARNLDLLGLPRFTERLAWALEAFRPQVGAVLPPRCATMLVAATSPSAHRDAVVFLTLALKAQRPERPDVTAALGVCLRYLACFSFQADNEARRQMETVRDGLCLLAVVSASSAEFGLVCDEHLEPRVNDLLRAVAATRQRAGSAAGTIAHSLAARMGMPEAPLKAQALLLQRARLLHALPAVLHSAAGRTYSTKCSQWTKLLSVLCLQAAWPGRGPGGISPVESSPVFSYLFRRWCALCAFGLSIPHCVARSEPMSMEPHRAKLRATAQQLAELYSFLTAGPSSAASSRPFFGIVSTGWDWILSEVEPGLAPLEAHSAAPGPVGGEDRVADLRECLLYPRPSYFHSTEKLWKDAAAGAAGFDAVSSAVAAKVRLTVMAAFYQQALGTAPLLSSASAGSELLCLLHASLVVLTQCLRVHLGEAPSAVDSSAPTGLAAHEFLGEGVGVLVVAAEALRLRGRPDGEGGPVDEAVRKLVAAWYDAVVPALGAAAAPQGPGGRVAEARALFGRLQACWDALHAYSRRALGEREGEGACGCVLCKGASCLVHDELQGQMGALAAKVLRLEGTDALKRSREAAGAGVGDAACELALSAAEEKFQTTLWRIHGTLSGHICILML